MQHLQYPIKHIYAMATVNLDEAKKQNTNGGEKWVSTLQDQIKSGLARNFLVLGEPGSGKSWACVRLAERLDLNGFTTDKIAYNSARFLELLDTAKKGDAIIYEEAGVNVNNRKWHENFGQNSIMQTVRAKNLFIILNCPDSSFIDKPIMKLMHYTFNMLRKNKEEGYSVMRPLRLSNDGQFNSYRSMYPMINGNLINEIVVSKPSLKLRRQYEKESTAYKNSLNKLMARRERESEKIQNSVKENKYTFETVENESPVSIEVSV